MNMRVLGLKKISFFISCQVIPHHIQFHAGLYRSAVREFFIAASLSASRKTSTMKIIPIITMVNKTSAGEGHTYQMNIQYK